MLPWLGWNVTVLLLLALAFCISYSVMKRWKANNMRVALVTFGGLPLFAWILGTVGWELDNELAVARAAFVYAVVLLPPSLFFLFIATRRESLFNNYATNLDRLGLLRKRQLRVADSGKTHYPVEDDLRMSRRVKGYLDRFGAAYGSLPEDKVNSFLDDIVGNSRGRRVETDPTTGELISSFDLKTVLPVFGAGALIALGWMMVLPPYPMVSASEPMNQLYQSYHLKGWYLWASEPVLLPVTFAFLGAYFFSLQMLVKRFTRRDLGPNAYNAVSMRIILATAGVWVAVQCFEAGHMVDQGPLLLVASFAVGAFPLIVWQLVANVLKKLPGAMIALPNLEGTLPLSQIDGLSVWHEARLDEEDIENVPNMATADIVDLMLNTKISPNRLINWVDQAMLLMVLPPQADQPGTPTVGKVLDQYAIRTASALVAATKAPGENKAALIDLLPENIRIQAIAAAAAVQLCPNYPLVQNWLSTEPYFPPNTPPVDPPGIPDALQVPMAAE
jgi:hypothetical protein